MHPPLPPCLPPTVELLFGGDAAAPEVAAGLALARGAILTRYLVEAPPNVCTPRHAPGPAVPALGDR